MSLPQNAKVYYFGCHCLIAVLQNHYDINHDNSQSKWTVEYEDLAGWLSDQLVFPTRQEKLSKDTEIKVYDEGEKRGDEVFAEMVSWMDRIIEDEIDANHDGGARSELTWYLYNRIVLRVIDKYKQVMVERLKNFPLYYEQYKTGIYLVDKLYYKIKCIEKIQDVRHEFVVTCEITSDVLAEFWQERILAEN
ncbi:MAG TPA: hypothetical protein VHO69_05300 [Phototrophicaceae bacterium]|nr:hypothetical protein [Phototrophicaceae bacterium]